mgnify:CR=1 FL=1
MKKNYSLLGTLICVSLYAAFLSHFKKFGPQSSGVLEKVDMEKIFGTGKVDMEKIFETGKAEQKFFLSNYFLLLFLRNMNSFLFDLCIYQITNI